MTVNLPFKNAVAGSLILAVFGGWLFAYCGVPLGWLIGSLIAVAVSQAFGLKPIKCKPFMPYVRGAVGTLLGATVTMSFLQLAIASWASILFLLASMILTILSGYVLLSWCFKVNPTTALLCSIPGGMTEMSMLSERPNCDQVQVATTHLFRVVLAVLVMPLVIAALYDIEINGASSNVNQSPMSLRDWCFFALCIASGVLLEKRCSLKASAILIPFGVCAALHLFGITDFVVPKYVVNLAQLAIGINLGSKFGNFNCKSLGTVSIAALAVVFGQILISVSLGLLAAMALSGDPITYIIAYSPGGLAEMSIIAVAMQLEAAFVALNHLFRLTAALMIAPTLLAYVENK